MQESINSQIYFIIGPGRQCTSALEILPTKTIYCNKVPARTRWSGVSVESSQLRHIQLTYVDGDPPDTAINTAMPREHE